jgi:hypothetical protein
VSFSWEKDLVIYTHVFLSSSLVFLIRVCTSLMASRSINIVRYSFLLCAGQVNRERDKYRSLGNVCNNNATILPVT